MAKKKPWHPSPNDSKPMRFIKILNLEWEDPERSSAVYDINVLEEIDTGEILLNVFRKGSTVITAVRLLDRNVGISTLHHEVRNNLRAWVAEKTPVWELDHAGFADISFPKVVDGAEVRAVDQEVKVKKVAKKDKLTTTNKVEEKPKRTRTRKPKEEPAVPKTPGVKGKAAPKRNRKPAEKKVTEKKVAPKPKAKTTKTPAKKKTTATKRKTSAKSKQLF